MLKQRFLWILLWSSTGLLLALGRIFVQDWTGFRVLVIQVLFALGLSLVSAWVVRVGGKFAVSFIVATLLGLVIGGFVQRWFMANGWHSGQVTFGSAIVLVSTLESSDSGRAGVRLWRTASGPKSLEARFEARLVDGTPGWDWYGERTKIEPFQEGGEIFTRWSTPKLGESLRRRYTLTTDLKVQRLRLTLKYRGSEKTCGRTQIVIGEKTRLIKQFCVSPQWQESTFEWQLSESEPSKVVRLILDNFEISSLEISSTLQIKQDAWETLPPPAPTGATFTLNWLGRDGPAPELRFVPNAQWQTYSFQSIHEIPSDVPKLITSVNLEPGLVLEVRKVILKSLDSSIVNPIPLPTQIRQSLFTPHANLAGHMLATLGLACLTLAPLPVGIGCWFASLTGIWLTGSRTAFFAILLGLLMALVMRIKRGRWWFYGVCLCVIGALLINSSFLGRLIEFGDEVISRPEVWQLAWDVFLDHSWTGVSPDEFKNYSLEQGVGVEAGGVTHAHNFWLYLASSYGIFGLIAGLWLTGGLLWLAWNWGRWRGVAFLTPILFMNIFDVSLFYIGVLLPLCLGLNSFWKRQTIKG
jgi:O-Antigen ligase